MTARVLWYHRGTKPMAAIYPDDIAGTNPLRELSSVAHLTPMHWEHAGSRPARATYPDDASAPGFTFTDPDARTSRVLWFHAGKGALTVAYPDALDAGGGEEPGYEGPLDLVSSAIVAYGPRALSAAMRGQPLATLREDGGDTEQEFSSDASTGEAPSAAITTFLDGANGFVKVWNDQSGNAKHAAQATSANQPAWDASAVGGKPGVVFDPAVTSRWLGTTGNVALGTGFIAFAVIAFSSAGVVIGQLGSTQDPGAMALRLSSNVVNAFYFDGGSGGETAYADDTAIDGAFHVMDTKCVLNASDIYLDNSLRTIVPSYTDPGPISIAAPLGIGDSEPGAEVAPLDGTIVELIVCPPTLSGAERLAVRQNQAAYYGITLG